MCDIKFESRYFAIHFVSVRYENRRTTKHFFMIARERTWENVFWKIFDFLCYKAFGTAVIRNWEIKRDKTYFFVLTLLALIWILQFLNTHKKLSLTAAELVNFSRYFFLILSYCTVKIFIYFAFRKQFFLFSFSYFTRFASRTFKNCGFFSFWLALEIWYLH